MMCGELNIAGCNLNFQTQDCYWKLETSRNIMYISWEEVIPKINIETMYVRIVESACLRSEGRENTYFMDGL